MARGNRTEVRVTPDEDGFEVRFGGGDEAAFRFLVGSLKRQIPPFARRYDPVGKCWRVKAEAADDLDAWLRAASRSPDVDVTWEPPDGLP